MKNEENEEKRRMSFKKILTASGSLFHILYEAAFIKILRGYWYWCKKLILSLLVCATPPAMECITLPGLGSGLGSIFLHPHYVFLLPEQGRFCYITFSKYFPQNRAAPRNVERQAVPTWPFAGRDESAWSWVQAKKPFTVDCLPLLSTILMHLHCCWVSSSVHPEPPKESLHWVTATTRPTCPGKR